MKWTELSAWCIFVCLSLAWHSASGQELNVIPNLLRPYIRSADQIQVINLMANISEKVFNFKKIGLKFGAFLDIFSSAATLNNGQGFLSQTQHYFATIMTL